jgi:hypothetical protein
LEPHLTHAMLIRYLLLLAGISLVFDGGDALARSTFSARFAQSAIAGPDIEQTTVLYLHYFAGDGEAIVGAHVQYLSADMSVHAVRSQRGVARLQSSRIEIDYEQRPLAGESVDTLFIDLTTKRSTGTISWSLALFSSAAENAAQQKTLALDLVPAPETTWYIEPARLYQGERSDVTIHIDHSDLTSRTLEQIEWRWPELIRPVGESVVAKALAAGESAEYSLAVHVGKTAIGPIEVAADARVGEMALAPLKAAIVHVDPLPKVEIAAELMQVGRPSAIMCRWRNESDQAIELDALRLQIHSAFSDIVLGQAPPNARLVVDGDRRYVLIDGLSALEAGSEIQVELKATPQRPGPFTWLVGARPQGRAEFIALAGNLAVGVAWGRAQRLAVEGKPLVTDLELMAAAFIEALEGQVGALPVGDHTPLYLQAGDKSDANWLVEDALLEMLRQRGYRLLVRRPLAGEEVGILHYRLASSRVVYSPGGGSWLPFVGSSKKREAYGDLVLRLETQPDGLVKWERRIRAYGSDVVPSGSADILGGGAMLKRATIEGENKAVERGLSASILGGLVYIFFIL